MDNTKDKNQNLFWKIFSLIILGIGFLVAALYFGGPILALIWVTIKGTYNAGCIGYSLFIAGIASLACYEWGLHKGRKQGYYLGINSGFKEGWDYRHEDDTPLDDDFEWVNYKSIGAVPLWKLHEE